MFGTLARLAVSSEPEGTHPQYSSTYCRPNNGFRVFGTYTVANIATVSVTIDIYNTGNACIT